MEALVRLQIYCGTHGNLRVDYVCNEVLDILEAAVNEALLVIYEIEKENVEAGGQDRRHVSQPVPKDHIHVVVLNELVQDHHSLILSFDPVILRITLHRVPHQQLLIHKLEEHEMTE